jgi:hypothetical protein
MRLTSAIAIFLLIPAQFFVSAALGEDNPLKAADLTKDEIEFFEANIRPVLVDRCYECHSSHAKKLKGKLLLDSKSGIAKGGDNGPTIVPGKVEESRLIQALRWTDPDLAMPPKEKLSA